MSPVPETDQAERLSVGKIYRRSIKADDFHFNRYVARPQAALLVYGLHSTRITPNQVTLVSFAVALVAFVTLVFCPGRIGLVAAAAVLHIAFVLDCVDGQLARIKNLSSPVGAYLDFLMDEIKAVLLLGSCAVRLAWTAQTPSFGPTWNAQIVWLTVGLVGCCIASSGISTTTFLRRPEYFEAVHGQKGERVAGYTKLVVLGTPKRALPSVLLWPVRLFEGLGRILLHYPAWFFIPACLGKLEWFLWPYLAAHTLYLGRAWLGLVWKLGR